jgi:hypothetical protein
MLYEKTISRSIGKMKTLCKKIVNPFLIIASITFLVVRFNFAMKILAMTCIFFITLITIYVIIFLMQRKKSNNSFISAIMKKSKELYSLLFGRDELLSLISQANESNCELVKNIQLVNNFIPDNEDWQKTIFLNDTGIAIQSISEEYTINHMESILFCSFLKFYNNGCPVSSNQIKNY